MQKEYDKWHKLKSKIHSEYHSPTFQEREVWWCSIGVNIGHETDGKHERFQRPVLILRKFNKVIFYAIPLTTKIKDNHYYFKFHFKDIEQCAMLTQIRLLDTVNIGFKERVVVKI